MQNPSGWVIDTLQVRLELELTFRYNIPSNDIQEVQENTKSKVDPIQSKVLNQEIYTHWHLVQWFSHGQNVPVC